MGSNFPAFEKPVCHVSALEVAFAIENVLFGVIVRISHDIRTVTQGCGVSGRKLPLKVVNVVRSMETAQECG